MIRRRSSGQNKLKISPVLLTLALFETVLWISFSFCVLSSASVSAQASLHSVGTGGTSDALPVRSFIQSQSQFLVTTPELTELSFEEPEAIEHSEASASILLQEYYSKFSLKDHPPELEFISNVPENKALQFRGSKSSRNARSTNLISEGSEEKEGKEGNNGKLIVVDIQ